MLEIANGIASSLTSAAIVQLIDGKIYLTLCDFCSTLWKNCAEEKIDLGMCVPHLLRPLRENMESEHITLVNSDVLAKLVSSEEQKEKLSALLERWSTRPISFSAHSLMHTPAYACPLTGKKFGVCLVVGVKCSSELEEFVKDFNSTMEATIKVNSLHVTIAVDSR